MSNKIEELVSQGWKIETWAVSPEFEGNTSPSIPWHKDGDIVYSIEPRENNKSVFRVLVKGEL